MEHQTYELLKRYANGQMPEAERIDFENKLKTDAAFAREAAEWAAIIKGLQAEGDRQLDENLHPLGARLMQSEDAGLRATVVNTAPARNFQMPRWLYAAAAVLLLLLIGWPIYQTLRPSVPVYADNRALFEKNFRVPATRGVRDAQTTPWQVAYQNKDYTGAAEQLEKLLAEPNQSNRSEAHLYLGISYLAAGQGQQALAAFGKVSSDSFDRDDAQWYSALAYIIIDDVVHAKQTLGEIAGKDGHPHRQEATEMLDAMK